MTLAPRFLEWWAALWRKPTIASALMRGGEIVLTLERI